jgi:hypothetical protein
MAKNQFRHIPSPKELGYGSVPEVSLLTGSSNNDLTTYVQRLVEKYNNDDKFSGIFNANKPSYVVLTSSEFTREMQGVKFAKKEVRYYQKSEQQETVQVIDNVNFIAIDRSLLNNFDSGRKNPALDYAILHAGVSSKVLDTTSNKLWKGANAAAAVVSIWVLAGPDSQVDPSAGLNGSGFLLTSIPAGLSELARATNLKTGFEDAMNKMLNAIGVKSPLQDIFESIVDKDKNLSSGATEYFKIHAEAISNNHIGEYEEINKNGISRNVSNIKGAIDAAYDKFIKGSFIDKAIKSMGGFESAR